MSETGEPCQAIGVGIDARVLRQRAELVGQRVAEVVAADLHRRGHGLVAGQALDEPALGVAADPDGVVELAQTRDGPRRPGPERSHVAAEHEALDPPAREVVEDRLERR